MLLMHKRRNIRAEGFSTASGTVIRPLLAFLRAGMCVAIVWAFAGYAQNTTSTPAGLRTDRIGFITPVNEAPDANTQMRMREQHGKQMNFSAANAERRKQIADASVQLLRRAADLNGELTRNEDAMPSPNAIRKADEIERLAHRVKEEMKLVLGAG
jgi:hypothetical protein